MPFLWVAWMSVILCWNSIPCEADYVFHAFHQYWIEVLANNPTLTTLTCPSIFCFNLGEHYWKTAITRKILKAPSNCCIFLTGIYFKYTIELVGLNITWLLDFNLINLDIHSLYATEMFLNKIWQNYHEV